MSGMMGIMTTMMAFPLLIVVALIAIVIWAAREFGIGGQPSRDRALEILDQRYASGEIEHDDYERRRGALLRRRD